jgi:hypothetical protein
MSHCRSISDARDKLQDASNILFGVRVHTNSQEIADEVAVVRAGIEHAIGRLSEALLAPVDA